MTVTTNKHYLHCLLVSYGEDPDTVLARKLDIYADEANVRGEIVTKKVEVFPGHTESVSFVVLWRTR